MTDQGYGKAPRSRGRTSASQRTPYSRPSNKKKLEKDTSTQATPPSEGTKGLIENVFSAAKTPLRAAASLIQKVCCIRDSTHLFAFPDVQFQFHSLLQVSFLGGYLSGGLRDNNVSDSGIAVMREENDTDGPSPIEQPRGSTPPKRRKQARTAIPDGKPPLKTGIAADEEEGGGGGARHVELTAEEPSVPPTIQIPQSPVIDFTSTPYDDILEKMRHGPFSSAADGAKTFTPPKARAPIESPGIQLTTTPVTTGAAATPGASNGNTMRPSRPYVGSRLGPFGSAGGGTTSPGGVGGGLRNIYTQKPISRFGRTPITSRALDSTQRIASAPPARAGQEDGSRTPIGWTPMRFHGASVLGTKRKAEGLDDAATPEVTSVAVLDAQRRIRQRSEPVAGGKASEVRRGWQSGRTPVSRPSRIPAPARMQFSLPALPASKDTQSVEPLGGTTETARRILATLDALDKVVTTPPDAATPRALPKISPPPTSSLTFAGLPSTEALTASKSDIRPKVTFGGVSFAPSPAQQTSVGHGTPPPRSSFGVLSTPSSAGATPAVTGSRKRAAEESPALAATPNPLFSFVEEKLPLAGVSEAMPATSEKTQILQTKVINETFVPCAPKEAEFTFGMTGKSDLAQKVARVVASCATAVQPLEPTPKYLFGEEKRKQKAASTPRSPICVVSKPSHPDQANKMAQEAAKSPLPPDTDEKRQEEEEEKKVPPAAGGWDLSFLQKNKESAQQASNAARKEAEASMPSPLDKLDNKASPSTLVFGAGRTPAAAFSFSAAEPPPAAAGWGDALLKPKKEGAAAVRDESEKASPGASAASMPVFNFGGAPSAGGMTFSFSSAAETKPATASSLSFGAVSTQPRIQNANAGKEVGVPSFGIAKETAPASQPAPTADWGSTFLEANKVASGAAASDVEKEIQDAAPTSNASFNFGAPVSPPVGFSFGAASAPVSTEPTSGVPAFTFGMSSTAETTTNFGAAMSTTGVQSASGIAPAFAFGSAPKEDKPMVAVPAFLASSSTPSNGANLFGAIAPKATISDQPVLFGAPASPASMHFGSSSTVAATVPPLMGASIPSTSESRPAFGVASGTSAFTFGSSAASAAVNDKPSFNFGGTSQPSFTFGMSSSSGPAFAGAPASSPFTFGAPPPVAFSGLGAPAAFASGAAFGSTSNMGAFSPSPAPGFDFGTSTEQQFAFGGSGSGQPAFGASQPAPAFGALAPAFGAPTSQQPIAFGSTAPAFGGFGAGQPGNVFTNQPQNPPSQMIPNNPFGGGGGFSMGSTGGSQSGSSRRKLKVKRPNR